MCKCKCYGETPLGIIGMARPALTNNSYIYIEKNKLLIFSDDPKSQPTEIPINFCPICGRNLDLEETE